MTALDAVTAIDIPESGLSKKLLVQANGARVLGLGFAAGHHLKEHTAPADVILHFVEGEAEVTVGTEQQTVHAGSLVHIGAKVPHSVRAIQPTKMLLTLLAS